MGACESSVQLGVALGIWRLSSLSLSPDAQLLPTQARFPQTSLNLSQLH